MRDRFLRAKNIVIDTGPLLIHAVGAIRIDKLKDVCLCGDPDEEFIFLERLFSSSKEFYITPYVLSELSYQLRTKLRLKKDGVEKFFNLYREFLNNIGEFHISKEKIINDKRIKFGLADISLMISHKENGSLIISSDEPFCKLCEKEDVEFIEYKSFFYNRMFI